MYKRQGTALTWHLAHRADRPERVVITAHRQVSLDRTREIHERSGLNTDQFEYRLLNAESPAEDADRIVDRSTLEFLHQAEAAQSRRELTVVDGWEYFVHGWSRVNAGVFHTPMPPERFIELSRIASTVR